MTDLHFANMISSVRTGDKLHSPIADINVSITALQLANISYFVNRELEIDTASGHIRNDSEAMKMWGRTYQPGWEPAV
jgi:hypothetical protein